MKAIVYQGPHARLAVADVPMPRAAAGELVFKVGACGICASDLHAAEVGLCPPGVVFGHEYAGEVIEVGAGVSGWQPGDRLVALPGRPCGTCAACSDGRTHQCASFVPQGFDPRMPGAYAEYSTAMAGMAIKIPASLSDRDAAVVEPLAVGLGAWRSAALPAGASVLVIGAGVIGLSVAKWARFFGAGDVAISELLPARLERARRMNVGLVIDGSIASDPVAEFQKQTGRAPTVIFECVGRPMVQRLIDIAPAGTQLVLVGTGMQPEQFTVLSAALKRLRMTFVIGYEPADFPFVLRMLDAGRIGVDGLVTATTSLADVPDVFARLQQPNDHCKVLITP
ncbi:MAG TPA: alcohol dehydrogenase catalytic domain-containing protein [Povalibacter sp.]|uniref:zinc-dependent alcohol dehydrogenase n=1 Tax=Povalibacter sp. TaxID=1962978 RepID=UPI002BA4C42D|nr:alcohol dehydrogenase catalytic domain-containing protein [Povalibacter sp.]HMN47017.1 alcohol dehydrogenase catalytic domain-containing protein [Povalibacter sp.]